MKLTRRNFIANTAAAGLGSILLPNLLSAAPPKRNVGIQLYSIKESLQKDFVKTLEKVAKIGYKELELAGYYNYSGKDLRKLLNDLGLSSVGTHIGIDVAKNELQKEIDFAKEVGHKYVIVPWMSARTLDDYKKAAEIFNKAGEACQAAGLQFCYHNHDFEFKPIDDKIPYDVLLESADPKLVKMELDLYWVVRAGHDPLEYFKKYPGRFELWHVKDMSKQDKDKNTEVGNGTIHWAPIFAKAKDSGMKHFFMEQENFDMDQMKSIELSYKFIRNIK